MSKKVAIVSGIDEAELENNINTKIDELEARRDVGEILDIKYASVTNIEAPVFGGIGGTKKLTAMIIYSVSS